MLFRVWHFSSQNKLNEEKTGQSSFETPYILLTRLVQEQRSTTTHTYAQYTTVLFLL